MEKEKEYELRGGIWDGENDGSSEEASSRLFDEVARKLERQDMGAFFRRLVEESQAHGYGSEEAPPPQKKGPKKKPSSLVRLARYAASEILLFADRQVLAASGPIVFKLSEMGLNQDRLQKAQEAFGMASAKIRKLRDKVDLHRDRIDIEREYAVDCVEMANDMDVVLCNEELQDSRGDMPIETWARGGNFPKNGIFQRDLLSWTW
jgi:hypothetical protein